MGPARSLGLALVLLASSGCATSSLTGPDERFAVIDGEEVPAPNIKMGDPATIERIIREGSENSQVLATLTEMAETFGPRLTGSAALEDAQRWSVEQLRGWGLENARLESWGTIATRFDRGESTGVVYLAPDDDGEDDADPKRLRDLEFSTLAWTHGTDGAVSGHVVAMPSTIEEYSANSGSYADAWVSIAPDYAGRGGIRSTGYLMRERLELRGETRRQLDGEVIESDKPVAGGDRWEGSMDYNGSKIPIFLTLTDTSESPQGTLEIQNFHTGAIQDAKLEGDNLRFRFSHSMGVSEIELSIDGDKASGTSTAASGNSYDLELTLTGGSDESEASQFKDPVLAAVLEENPAGFISSSKDERVWTTSANGWRTRELADYPTDIEVNVRESDHDFITARLEQGVDIRVEFDLDHQLAAGPIPVFNVFAEIVGSERPDEVIIVSGHQDSWDGPGSQGVVDNGTGTAVTLEAARILAASGAKPKRTIRFALWSGEEQGLLGARAYVRSLSEEELAGISAVFVDDGGTNTQGGAPAADFMVPMLAAATSWTNGRFYSETDGKFLNVNIRPTGDELSTHGGSDHAAFNAVGVPGFFWDEVGRAKYRYAWHTQNDRLDQAIEEYLVQSAVNTAVTAYNLACAPTMLPREGEGSGEADAGEVASAK